MDVILVQIFDLIKVALFCGTCVYILHKIFSRRPKKVSIKFKDDLAVITEYFE